MGTYVSREHMRVHFGRWTQSPLSCCEQIVNALLPPALVSASGKLGIPRSTLHSTQRFQASFLPLSATGVAGFHWRTLPGLPVPALPRDSGGYDHENSEISEPSLPVSSLKRLLFNGLALAVAMHSLKSERHNE